MTRGTRQGAQGGNTGSVEWTPQARKRVKRARGRQEERWAAKAGPVTVAYLPGMEPPSGALEPSQEPRKSPRTGPPTPVLVGKTGDPVPDNGEDWPPWEAGPS